MSISFTAPSRTQSHTQQKKTHNKTVWNVSMWRHTNDKLMNIANLYLGEHDLWLSYFFMWYLHTTEKILENKSFLLAAGSYICEPLFE